MQILNENQLIAFLIHFVGQIQEQSESITNLKTLTIKKKREGYLLENEMFDGKSLPIEDLFSASDEEFEPEKGHNENIQSKASRTKSFISYEGKIMVRPDALNMNKNQIAAKVIESDPPFRGPKTIKLYPDRGFMGFRTMAIACAEQIDLRLKVMNNEHMGQSHYFVSDVSIVQGDLFKTDLINFLENEFCKE